MKSGLNLAELATEIMRRQAAKEDYVVPAKAVEVTGDLDVTFGDKKFGINDFAHGQIAGYLDVPKKYYDRMRREEPRLLAQNVNTWLRKSDDKRTLRFLDGKLRALLSDAYRPLENEDLASAVLPVIAEAGLDVMSSQITDTRLYIKVVDKRVTRELEAVGARFGDGKNNIVRCLAPALTISNSEVGQGALSVLGGVYDGFCSNLATFGERSTRKYHVGRRHELVGEDSYALLSDDTRRKTDAATWAQIADVVRGAFDRAKFDALCDKITATRDDKIEGDLVKAVSFTAVKFGMNEAAEKSVLKHLIEGADLSRFGLYNAITRASQDVEDYDLASQMERDGAKIIELPKTEWQTLAQAA